MRVLFVASVYRHLAHFHIPYMKYFQSQGYEVWAAGNDHDHAKEVLTKLDIKCIDIPFSRSPLSSDNLKALRQLNVLFQQETFDLVHVHTPVAALLTRLSYKKTQNRKIIYTAHGFHFFEGAPLQNWLIYYPLEKIAAKWTDRLITINEEDYTRALRFMGPEKTALVHGVGVEFEEFQLNDKEKYSLKEQLGLVHDSIVISYVAELNANKNHMFLLHNWHSLKEKNPKAELLIIGTGEDEHKLKETVKEMNLSGVHFLGYRTDVAKLLLISDIVTLLSHREGLPKSIMEAMAAALPCVVTNTRGLRDLVINDKNGFVVDHHDHQRLIHVFDALLNSKQLRTELGENAKEMVQPYLLDNVIAEYDVIYNQLLQSKGD